MFLPSEHHKAAFSYRKKRLYDVMRKIVRKGRVLGEGGAVFPRKIPSFFHVFYRCETISPVRVRAVPTMARGVIVS